MFTRAPATATTAMVAFFRKVVVKDMLGRTALGAEMVPCQVLFRCSINRVEIVPDPRTTDAHFPRGVDVIVEIRMTGSPGK